MKLYRFYLRFSLLIISLLIISLSLCAQSGRISGTISDMSTGNPLIGANVYIQGTSIGAAADIHGVYAIPRVPAGRYTLVVSYLGYQREERNFEIREGEHLVLNVQLEWSGVTLEEVVITAQARGQVGAINQQLTSNTITNIVSADRIRELPDVNAAESIGRLPGVSIQRSGGEATKISIRGLSPKYNTITVNGVRVPSTGGDDRSVDLSLISSNMLEGIEVMKAITPDQDADAIGGSVDLKLREAPDGIKANIMVQGGYNQLQEHYGNYNITGNISNRFFNSNLGVIANFNLDEYDRSADKFSGSYREQRETISEVVTIQNVITTLSLREESVVRGRTGASMLLDYRIPNGKVTANSFYNRLESDALYRINRMNVNDNRHYFDLQDRGGTTSIFTGVLGAEQNFGVLLVDASIARTASRTDNPGERTWAFVRENNAFDRGEIGPDTHPTYIPTVALMDSFQTIFQEAYVLDTKRHENQTTAQLNIEIPFRLSDQISGSVKTGGKFRWLDRKNDVEQTGRGALQYGNNPINTTLRLISQQINDWDYNIEDIVREHGGLPVWYFLSNYSRSGFMNDEYPLGFVYDKTMMDRMTDAIFASDEDLRYSIASIGSDYEGVERYQAGYIMSTFNIGRHVMFLPGIRWEGDYSRYNGLRFREVTPNNVEAAPTDLDTLKVVREHEFWLPMVHVKVSPTNWLDLRLAWTETLTRPDFIHYAPITSINSFQSYIRAANSLLKPSRSTNYDVAVSVYQNHIGLFTVAGFSKEVSDLIFQSGYVIRRVGGVSMPVLPGLNIPEHWLQSSPNHDTYINSPHPAYYRGFELDWQTNFWYLPRPFQGIVLNINYTRIFSEMKRQIYYSVRAAEPIEGTWPPLYPWELRDSTRTSRMPDQPAHIANISVGYDYGGFSARVSFLYQTDVVTYVDRLESLDTFSDDYARWDISVKQRIPWGVELFANFNNLNSRADRSYRGSSLNHPTYIEYYGFTMDVGFRYSI
jgi:TonB-dependent receptor